jgi:hypothetical protein
MIYIGQLLPAFNTTDPYKYWSETVSYYETKRELGC